VRELLKTERVQQWIEIEVKRLMEEGNLDRKGARYLLRENLLAMRKYFPHFKKALENIIWILS